MKVPQLSVQEAADLLKNNAYATLIDVRSDAEYATARIPGSILINSDKKAQEILQLPKDTPVVIHCHHGMRSLNAVGWLMNQGFTNVYNMDGGIDAWSRKVDSSVRRY